MEIQRREVLNRINRLSNDSSADHRQELKELKNDYNRIMDEICNSALGTPKDILYVFPSEIWIQIVKDALPARGYSSALLLLTMVSKKWMQALVSVPTLWTHIEIRGSQEDSLATIDVFKQLSGNISLSVSIYVPMHHDTALMNSILAAIAPRLREVTIRQEKNNSFDIKGTSSVVSFLLRNHHHTSTVVYMHIEELGSRPLYDNEIAHLIRNNPLPPPLRGLSGWSFLWSDFAQAENYLQNLEEIRSHVPIELVLSDRAQLPSLRSISIYESEMVHVLKFDPAMQKGLPRLANLTSLTYRNAFREVFIHLLASVGPQLLHLELRIPHTRVPILVSCLQASTRLRSLSVEVDKWREYDQGESNINERLALPVIVRNVPSLRELKIGTVSTNNHVPSEISYPDSLFTSFIRVLRLLYQDTEKLEFAIGFRHVASAEVILSYISDLKMLRRLYWKGIPGTVELNEEPMREATTIEYLAIANPQVLHCLQAANLLSLDFTCGYNTQAFNLRHAHVRKLSITYFGAILSMVEISEDSFPSVVELNLDFQTFNSGVPSSLKLGSPPMLSSITIISSGFDPYLTMLCLELLYQPKNCPALNEITFQRSLPDWDAFFLMLEKRNFMVDMAVSKICKVHLPFVPEELRSPLASLLGGRYAERPSNEDLFLGGAQDLIFDENIPGCLTCLIDMRGDCEEKVLRVGKDPIYWIDQLHSMSLRFHCGPDPAGEGVAAGDWMKQRRSLHRNFLETLDSWGHKYQRTTRCRFFEELMEISEYGACVPSYSLV